MSRKSAIQVFEANKPILCGHITFVVDRSIAWRFVCDPYGDLVYSGNSTNNLSPVSDFAVRFEDYLPNGWDYEEFMIMWASWADGYEAGVRQGKKI